MLGDGQLSALRYVGPKCPKLWLWSHILSQPLECQIQIQRRVDDWTYLRTELRFAKAVTTIQNPLSYLSGTELDAANSVPRTWIWHSRGWGNCQWHNHHLQCHGDLLICLRSSQDMTSKSLGHCRTLWRIASKPPDRILPWKKGMNHC